MPVRNQSIYDSNGGVLIKPPKKEEAPKEEKKNEVKKHPKKQGAFLMRKTEYLIFKGIICEKSAEMPFQYAKNKKERKAIWIFQQQERVWQSWLSAI